MRIIENKIIASKVIENKIAEDPKSDGRWVYTNWVLLRCGLSIWRCRTRCLLDWQTKRGFLPPYKSLGTSGRNAVQNARCHLVSVCSDHGRSFVCTGNQNCRRFTEVLPVNFSIESQKIAFRISPFPVVVAFVFGSRNEFKHFAGDNVVQHYCPRRPQ